MKVGSRLSVRIRATLYDEYGNEKELFDTTFSPETLELQREAEQLSPELKEKILKYLEEINYEK